MAARFFFMAAVNFSLCAKDEIIKRKQPVIRSNFFIFIYFKMIDFYKLLFMASCVRSIPKLKKQPMNTKRLLGGVTASFRLPSLL